jgi:hypothetical protein
VKKGILALALSAFVAGGVFAESMFSVGGGFSFSGGRVGRIFDDSDNWSGYNALGFGGHAFFDARFAEVSLGIMGGPVNDIEVSDGDRETERWGSLLAMELSLLGKFPVDMGGFTFFPLLGFGYSIGLSFTDEDGNSFDDVGDAFNTFRIKFGVGADFDINESLFFRTSVLGWYGFAPSLVSDWADLTNAFGGDVSARGGFGASVRLGVGFRF